MLESPFNRLEGLNFLKKGLQHRRFPVNITKFLRTLFSMKICEQLLLQFVLLTVDIFSWVLVSALNSTGILQRSSSRFKEFSVGCLVVGSSLIWKKKREISRNGHSLSFFVPLIVIRCHSLSLFVICCHSLYHSLSFVVTRCTTCCYSLSLYVTLVCLFINNQVNQTGLILFENYGWIIRLSIYSL